MIIPKELTIKGERWKIDFADTLQDEETGDCLYGHCDFENRTITIVMHLDQDLTEVVFLHELVHACLFELHVDIDTGTNEVISDGIAYIFQKLFNMELKEADVENLVDN